MHGGPSLFWVNDRPLLEREDKAGVAVGPGLTQWGHSLLAVKEGVRKRRSATHWDVDSEYAIDPPPPSNNTALFSANRDHYISRVYTYKEVLSNRHWPAYQNKKNMIKKKKNCVLIDDFPKFCQCQFAKLQKRHYFNYLNIIISGMQFTPGIYEPFLTICWCFNETKSLKA